MNKSGLIIASSLVFFSALASSKSILRVSLEDEIMKSETVITSQIISGKCVLANCEGSYPRVRFKEYKIRFKEYTTRCIGAISGQCPTMPKFQSASELKVGATYILLTFTNRDGMPAVFRSFELQNDNKEVVFNSNTQGLINIPLYKRVSESRPLTIQYYYRYSDFVSVIRSIKSDPRLKN